MEWDKEKSRLVQYAVIIKESDFPYKRYIWASEKAIEDSLKPYTFAGETPGTKHIIDMTHIIFEGKPEDIKKSEKSAKAKFIEGEFGSLELEVDTEQDAVKCLKSLKLR